MMLLRAFTSLHHRKSSAHSCFHVAGPNSLSCTAFFGRPVSVPARLWLCMCSSSTLAGSSSGS
jgi:hypothetical protein